MHRSPLICTSVETWLLHVFHSSSSAAFIFLSWIAFIYKLIYLDSEQMPLLFNSPFRITSPRTNSKHYSGCLSSHFNVFPNGSDLIWRSDWNCFETRNLIWFERYFISFDLCYVFFELPDRPYIRVHMCPWQFSAPSLITRAFLRIDQCKHQDYCWQPRLIALFPLLLIPTGSYSHSVITWIQNAQ